MLSWIHHCKVPHNRAKFPKVFGGNKMEYEAFVETMRELVASFSGANTTVMVTEVNKNNGVKRMGLMLKEKTSNVAPTVYLEDFYDEFQRGKSLSEMAQAIVKAYQNRQFHCGFDVEQFKDFQKIKERIVYRIVNKEKNEELLKESPYIEFLDLAVVPYVTFFMEDGTIGAILMKKEHLELWNVSEEVVLRIAGENTHKFLPPKISKMEDTLRELFVMNHLEQEQGVEQFLEDMEANSDKIPMYVLTNQRNWYGAACMLYEGVIEMFAQQLQKDVYILPSSVHEVLLVPAAEELCPEELTDMVQEINMTQIPIEEVLSDHVYKYSIEERGFCIA